MSEEGKRKRERNLKPIKPMGDTALAGTPLCTKVRQDIYDAVRSLDNRAMWLREVIEAAAIQQGLIENSNDLEEATNTSISTSKDYECIKSKIINEWGKQGRMKQTEVVSLAIDKFIEEISK